MKRVYIIPQVILFKTKQFLLPSKYYWRNEQLIKFSILKNSFSPLRSNKSRSILPRPTIKLIYRLMVAVALSRSLLFFVAFSFKARLGIVLMRVENERCQLTSSLAARKYIVPNTFSCI